MILISCTVFINFKELNLNINAVNFFFAQLFDRMQLLLFAILLITLTKRYFHSIGLWLFAFVQAFKVFATIVDYHILMFDKYDGWFAVIARTITVIPFLVLTIEVIIYRKSLTFN